MSASGYGTEQVTRGEVIAFKIAVRSAIAQELEQEWLGTFVSAIREGESVWDAVEGASDEWDL